MGDYAALAEARGDGLYRAVVLDHGFKECVPGYQATTQERALYAANEYLSFLLRVRTALPDLPGKRATAAAW